MPARVHETSAGGMAVRVIDGSAAVAVIGRINRAGRLQWSLPKGHVEPGETIEQAAVREVAEETGIIAEITAPLGSLRYSFNSGRRRIHKQVHHFLMTAVGGELSDADVEVTEVAWVPLQRLPHILGYPAERRLVRRGAQLLAGVE